MFGAIWLMDAIMSRDVLRWANSLPFGLGAPVFVVGGTIATGLVAFAPVIIWALFASAIDARSGETRQGLDPKDESAVAESETPNA